MLKIRVKADCISNLTDARYFAAREVEWLSFCFIENHENYIEPIKARAMFDWVEGVRIVGEFDELEATALNFYIENWQLKNIQVGNRTTAAQLVGVENAHILKEFEMEAATTAANLRTLCTDFEPLVEAFVLNFKKNQLSFADISRSAAAIGFSDLADLCNTFKIILNIDFEAAQLAEISTLNLYGLSIEGGEEERVGVKSFQELDAILDILEADEV
jgi:phosphoribosylanthranilate isomerase